MANLRTTVEDVIREMPMAKNAYDIAEAANRIVSLVEKDDEIVYYTSPELIHRTRMVITSAEFTPGWDEACIRLTDTEGGHISFLEVRWPIHAVSEWAVGSNVEVVILEAP